MGLKKVKLLRCVNIITMRSESHRLNYLSVVSRTNRPCVRRGARTLNRRSTIVEPNGRAASSRTPRATRRRLDRDERPFTARGIGGASRRVRARVRVDGRVDARSTRPETAASHRGRGGTRRGRRARATMARRERRSDALLHRRDRRARVHGRRARLPRTGRHGWMMTDAIVAVTGAVRRG